MSVQRMQEVEVSGDSFLVSTLRHCSAISQALLWLRDYASELQWAR